MEISLDEINDEVNIILKPKKDKKIAVNEIEKCLDFVTTNKKT